MLSIMRVHFSWRVTWTDSAKYYKDSTCMKVTLSLWYFGGPFTIFKWIFIFFYKASSRVQPLYCDPSANSLLVKYTRYETAGLFLISLYGINLTLQSINYSVEQYIQCRCESCNVLCL